MLGGYAAAGGHLGVIWQPFEMIIILGSALGTFIVANPLNTIKDTGKAVLEAIKGAKPKQRDYLDVLGLLYTLMRELRGNARNEVESHIDAPQDSENLQEISEGHRRQGHDRLHLRLLPPDPDRQRPDP